MIETTEQLSDDDDSPPILGAWQNLYLLVLVLHAIFIAVLYWFTLTYA
jgi:hypothetical protein